MKILFLLVFATALFAAPDSCAPSGFYVEADFLWWRAENHGFSYAFDRTSSVAYSGDVVRLDPEWKPGFRAMVGWNIKDCSWDLLLDWTWYLNHASEMRSRSDVSHGTVQGFYPLFPLDTGGNASYQTVQANWRLVYDTVDLEIGRAFCPVTALSLRPHWGVRGALVDQQFDDFFSEEFNPSDINAAEMQFEGRNFYWGVGPRAGSNAEWHLGSGFSVVGNLTAALLYGRTHVSFLTETALFAGGSLDTYQKYQDAFEQLVPTLQMMLGVQWGTCFASEKKYVGLNVCWEGNYWWNQFNIPFARTYVSGSLIEPNYPFPTVGNQPVTMEGMTANLHLNF